MTLFRMRYATLGGHTHVSIWAGKGTLSLGLAGTLVFQNNEWEDFKALMPTMGNVEMYEQKFSLHPEPGVEDY